MTKTADMADVVAGLRLLIDNADDLAELIGLVAFRARAANVGDDVFRPASTAQRLTRQLAMQLAQVAALAVDMEPNRT